MPNTELLHGKPWGGFCELLGRSLGGWLAVTLLGFPGVCLANPMAWLFALIYCAVMTMVFLKKREKALDGA